MQRSLKILFLTTRYPSEIHYRDGLFFRQYAKAASLQHDVVTVYAFPSPSPKPWKMCDITEDVEEGRRRIRIGYSGLPYYISAKLTPTKSPLSTDSAGAAVRTTSARPRLTAIPRQMIRDLILFPSVAAVLRRLTKAGWRPDVVHAHEFVEGVPAVILGRLHHIPVVITEEYSGFPRRLLGCLSRLEARFALNRASMVLPVSNYLREHIEAYGITNTFRVVPNPIDMEVFHPPFQQPTTDHAKRRILFVGSLIPVKGIPYLFEALSRLREKRQDFVLDLVGEGTNRSEYEQLARSLRLDEVVFFHGLKSNPEVAQYMRRCDFLVQPSILETFGVVHIEAMACGKPVVATNVGGPNDTVVQGAGILVRPRDAQALQQAIDHMLDNLSAFPSGKIAASVRERFSYEAVGTTLDEVYQEVCQPSSVRDSP